MQKELTHRIEERRTLAVSLQQTNTALLLAEIQTLLALKNAEISALKRGTMALREGLQDIAHTILFEPVLAPRHADGLAFEVFAEEDQPSKEEVDAEVSNAPKKSSAQPR